MTKGCSMRTDLCILYVCVSECVLRKQAHERAQRQRETPGTYLCASIYVTSFTEQVSHFLLNEATE